MVLYYDKPNAEYTYFLLKSHIRQGRSPKWTVVGLFVRRETELLGYGIVPVAAPGVTSNNTPDGQQQAIYRAVFFQGFDGIGRTGRCEITVRSEHG